MTDEENRLLKKKNELMKKQYDTLIKNMKPIIFGEAVRFVKEQSNNLTRIVTNEHHRMLNNFLAFRADLLKIRADNENYRRFLAMLEILEALRMPALEGSHAMDKHKSGLLLFDSIVPQISEYRHYCCLAKLGKKAKNVVDQEAYIAAI